MKNARQVNPDLEFFQLSGLKGDGMESWFEFLRASVRAAGSVV
jgi:Ni2+-binding GTPase involved in maturation of urease and hydrogenase